MLAKATVLPASSAAQVLRRPALPTIADTTMSTSGRRTTVSSAFGADQQFDAARASRTNLAAAAACGSVTTTHRGATSAACSSSTSVLPWADSATARRLPSRRGDHLQRAAADAAGRAQHGDVVSRGLVMRADASLVVILRHAAADTVARIRDNAECLIGRQIAD